ncbi:hypothetical protein KCU77_g4552, partial [Aureobasidium melanogenum]
MDPSSNLVPRLQRNMFQPYSEARDDDENYDLDNYPDSPMSDNSDTEDLNDSQHNLHNEPTFHLEDITDLFNVDVVKSSEFDQIYKRILQLVQEYATEPATIVYAKVNSVKLATINEAKASNIVDAALPSMTEAEYHLGMPARIEEKVRGMPRLWNTWNVLVIPTLTSPLAPEFVPCYNDMIVAPFGMEMTALRRALPDPQSKSRTVEQQKASKKQRRNKRVRQKKNKGKNKGMTKPATFQLALR